MIRESIYSTLRRELLDCTVLPGSEIHEPELSERFSSSRSPVRDALLRLEAEGLVVIHPRKGYQATPILLADAADFCDLRALLEPACILNSATSAHDDVIDAFDRFRSIEAFGATVNELGSVGFAAYSRAFHLSLASACTNRRLREAALRAIEQFHRLVRFGIGQSDIGEHSFPVAQYVEIIDALQVRDGHAAAEGLRAIISQSCEFVLREISRAAIA